MPSPKRWFPASRDMNHDPEVWLLTDQFGDRAFRLWYELLAILDRHDNEIKVVDNLWSSLARTLRMTPANVQRAVDWMLARGWLEAGQLSISGSPTSLSAPNYGKYHRMREPSGSQRGAPPNRTEQNRTLKRGVPPVDNSEPKATISEREAIEILDRLGVSPKGMTDA